MHGTPTVPWWAQIATALILILMTFPKLREA